MQAEKLEFDAVRYNPELEGFEAKVTIHDQGEVFAYPVQLRAPVHADYAMVARRLVQEGLTLHAGTRKSPRLRSRRLAAMHHTAVAA